MKKRLVYLKGITIIILLVFLQACSTAVDINNEKAVMDNIQGDWTGCISIGSMYSHIKISIDDNLFKAWMKMSDDEEEPVWPDTPDEKGCITLSSLLKHPEKDLSYRKFAFTCAGRCCRDKSVAIQTLSDRLTYVDGKGLSIGENVKMIRK